MGIEAINKRIHKEQMRIAKIAILIKDVRLEPQSVAQLAVNSGISTCYEDAMDLIAIGVSGGNFDADKEWMITVPRPGNDRC